MVKNSSLLVQPSHLITATELLLAIYKLLGIKLRPK